jgi:hypothetical protein
VPDFFYLRQENSYNGASVKEVRRFDRESDLKFDLSFCLGATGSLAGGGETIAFSIPPPWR